MVVGSLQQLTGESVAIGGNTSISGDLLVPGTPDVILNGTVDYQGTIDGTGNASPSGYQVTLQGGVSLRHVVRRTDPGTLPAVSPPPAPAGTRDVTINSSAQSVGDFSTLRSLTLGGGAGQVAIPPGTYGDFSANGANGFILGVTGSSAPSVYNLQSLAFSGTAGLQIVGPIILTVGGDVVFGGTSGSSTHPEWLMLNVSSGNVTVNGGGVLYGMVQAPNGTVTLRGNSQLVGGLDADRLTLEGTSLLKLQGTGPQPPVATPQSVTLVENTSVAITLAGTQANGDPLTYTVATPPAHGTLTGTAPNLTYTPATNFYGADSFTFTAIDGTASSAPATISIAVTESPPVATPQSVTVMENASLVITLAGTQVNGDPLTYTVATPPAHGTLTGTAPNLTYTPATNFYGADSFTFTAIDGALSSAPATITIAVTEAPPVATPQSVTLVENTSVAITLAGTQVNGDPLTYAVATPPAHGTLTGTAPNLTYTPAPNFYGSDSFTFTAIDGAASSAPATISIAVTESPPVATPQSVTVMENASLVITLAGTQVNGDPLTYAVATPPAHGTLTGTAPNLTYTPAANYSGVDSFTFVATDGALSSSPATVSITVQALQTTSTLVVINGTGTVLAGDTYTIVSNPAPAGTIFAGWQVNSGSGTFANAKYSKTTFTAAPQITTTIQANYVTLTAQTDVNGDGIPDLLEVDAGTLDPSNPSDPNDPKNTASPANYQNYSYDNDNQVIAAPESNYQYDKEGNASPAHQ